VSWSPQWYVSISMAPPSTMYCSPVLEILGFYPFTYFVLNSGWPVRGNKSIISVSYLKSYTSFFTMKPGKILEFLKLVFWAPFTMSHKTVTSPFPLVSESTVVEESCVGFSVVLPSAVKPYALILFPSFQRLMRHRKFQLATKSLQIERQIRTLCACTNEL
jgi:hypothetical protein